VKTHELPKNFRSRIGVLSKYFSLVNARNEGESWGSAVVAAIQETKALGWVAIRRDKATLFRSYLAGKLGWPRLQCGPRCGTNAISAFDEPGRFS